MLEYFAQLPTVIFDTIGVVGFALYVMNYTLLTFQRITSGSSLYFVINLCASSCVLIGLSHSFNLASALLQTFWIVMSITAIFVRVRRRRRVRLLGEFA